jgi:hypothetical protein
LLNYYLKDTNDASNKSEPKERRNKSQLKYNIITDPVEKVTTSPYILREVEKHQNALRGAAKIMLSDGN